MPDTVPTNVPRTRSSADLEAINLSAVQLMELDCVHQLASGTAEEQILSLKKLAELPICDATQATVASCLHDTKLMVWPVFHAAVHPHLGMFCLELWTTTCGFLEAR